MNSERSTFSLALVAFHTRLKDSAQQDLFGQLPSASKTPSARQSSANTGPTHPSTTTSEPSRQMSLGESTSSQAVFLANPGVSPGSKEAQKMTEISGRKCCELLKLYKVDGSLGRMCAGLLTSQWASSAAFLTWRGSGTKPSHLLFQLAPSMPRTDEIGSGLWATPRTSDIKSGRTLNEQGKRTSKSSDLTFGANLADQVKLWPTPTTRDHKGGRKPQTLAASGRGETNSLNDAVTVRDQYGSLNSAWVCRLMGYPDGWLEIGSEAFQELRIKKKAER